MSQQQQQQPRGHAPVEPEQCLILRVPQSAADKLRADIQSGQPLQDRLSLEARQDLRNFTLNYDDESLPGRLVDLPCIVEVHKTADSRTFYKVANVTQMLVCGGEDPSASASAAARSYQSRRRRRSNSESAAVVTVSAEERRHQWDHGLTPPLKNVRRRRFRRVLRNRSMDMPELEKEVKRLLRNDMEAADIKWEVLTEEEAAKLDSAASQQQPPAPQDEQPASSSQAVGGEAASSNIMMATQLFGDISDSSTSGSDQEDSDDERQGAGDGGEEKADGDDMQED